MYNTPPRIQGALTPHWLHMHKHNIKSTKCATNKLVVVFYLGHLLLPLINGLNLLHIAFCWSYWAHKVLHTGGIFTLLYFYGHTLIHRSVGSLRLRALPRGTSTWQVEAGTEPTILQSQANCNIHTETISSYILIVAGNTLVNGFWPGQSDTMTLIFSFSMFKFKKAKQQTVWWGKIWF